MRQRSPPGGSRPITPRRPWGGSVNRLTGKVEALEAKPGKRWDGLLDKALLVLCGTFVAWLASGAPGL